MYLCRLYTGNILTHLNLMKIGQFQKIVNALILDIFDFKIMSRVILLFGLIILNSCRSPTFLVNNDSLSKEESRVVKKCVEQNLEYLKEKGILVEKNKKDNRYYIGAIGDDIMSVFEVNCNNINLLFNDTIQKPNYDKVFIYKNVKENNLVKINHGFEKLAGAPGVFRTQCEYYKNGKLKVCYDGKVIYEVDSISRKIKKSYLGL